MVPCAVRCVLCVARVWLREGGGVEGLAFYCLGKGFSLKCVRLLIVVGIGWLGSRFDWVWSNFKLA
jgi:hypothetical protein